MGRKPTVNLNLPPRMRVKTRGLRTYYYYDAGGKPRKWHSLGSDYIDAIRKYADYEQGNAKSLNNPTVTDAWHRYCTVVLPSKSPTTQRGNLSEIKKILYTFGEAKLREVKPHHIRQYLDHYRASPRQANKEMALFSHIFNCAREWGMIDTENPVLGVKKHRTTGREVYVDDTLYMAVYNHADQPLRDYMDFIWLSGQRNADVLKADEKHIKDGAYWFTQGKTGTKIRVQITGEFGALIERIRQRRLTYIVMSTRLIIDTDGRPISPDKIRSRFDRAREAAGIEKSAFQLRDLRAKAATEKEQSDGIEAAQNQLGHASGQMTRHYVRNRIGKLVKPTK